MSNVSIRISPLGAFSHEWNKGIDNRDTFFINLGKSMVGFLKALFFGYKVSEAEVDESFISGAGTHNGSIFVKEYRKKFGERKVELKLAGEQINEKVNEQIHSNGELNNYEKKETLKTKKNHLEKSGEEVSDPALVKKIEALINSYSTVWSDDDAERLLTKENIDLLGKKDCCRLFELSFSSENYHIAGRLLLSGKCDELLPILDSKHNMLCWFAADTTLDALEYLLKKKLFDIDGTMDGMTPLTIAAKNDHEKCIKALLDAGANPNKATEEGACLAMLFTAGFGNVNTLDMLMKAGADVNVAYRGGNLQTALHIRGVNSVEFLTRLLEDENINVNVKDKNGNTPLHYCIKTLSNEMIIKEGSLYTKPMEECFRILLSTPKVNLNEQNNKGLTPIGLAEELGKDIWMGKRQLGKRQWCIDRLRENGAS